jgi:hypothetical protein
MHLYSMQHKIIQYLCTLAKCSKTNYGENQGNNVVEHVLGMAFFMDERRKANIVHAWRMVLDALVWHAAQESTIPLHIGEMVNNELTIKSM